MLRTQISLTEAERRILDDAAARTGRSMSALIRDAVDIVYGAQRPAEDDIVAMRRAFGTWAGTDRDGEQWVDSVRTGRRLLKST